MKRPLNPPMHGDSLSMAGNLIKAPARVKFAGDRPTANGDEIARPTEPKPQLDSFLESDDDSDEDESGFIEPPRPRSVAPTPSVSERRQSVTSADNDLPSTAATTAATKRPPRVVKFANPPESKAAAAAGPDKKPPPPKASTPSGEADTAQSSIDQVLRKSLEQQQLLQTELNQYKQRAERFELEVKAFKLAKEQEADRLGQQSKAVAALESRLALETRDKVFWSKKHEELHRQYLKTESEYRILQATTADRDGMWKREWERKNEHLLLERDRCRDGFHSAQKVAQDRQEETRELRRQVLDLKHSISTSTRMEGQITDDVFREKIRLLGHDLQNWTITHFRKRDLGTMHAPLRPALEADPSSTPALSALSNSAREELSLAVPLYGSLMPGSKLHVVQSIVSSMLCQDIFSHYFFGLQPDWIAQCLQMEAYLSTISTLFLFRPTGQPDVQQVQRRWSINGAPRPWPSCGTAPTPICKRTWRNRRASYASASPIC